MWKGEFYKIIWKYREIFNKGFFSEKYKIHLHSTFVRKIRKGDYFNSSKGTIFKETSGKEELIGPRDFVISYVQTLISPFIILCFEDTIKLASIVGTRGQVNIRFRHFLLFIRDSLSVRRNRRNEISRSSLNLSAKFRAKYFLPHIFRGDIIIFDSIKNLLFQICYQTFEMISCKIIIERSRILCVSMQFKHRPEI